ncbi:hypothetical protein BS47DRAFT_1287370 [Hydnum rufescens UP504]|uniref:Protein kinase domain-containing protein n=1 Tax=Hydnum rufescens UP504 TaxID=1448309 RepID=A0A9P6E2H7_9AGAM|nr:hypothetical protein BS47DRAFT_1287370 [Hydnum rufescens UP504]
MSIDAISHPLLRAGFRRVRDSRDLRPRINSQPQGRRADPSGNGTFLSPLKCLTTHLAQTYNICNPQFRYETAHNPRRVLTKPSKPVHNDGYDNEDYDYILYVNDWLGAEEGHNKYLILDVLGQGTFGQVVKCQNMKTHEIVAVKVVKNKPAYFNQSMMEVTILELLNNTWDPHDEHHILRLRDTFIHRSHLCLVFELLSSNLYELIKQNSFGGLSTQLVKVFTAQLLDSLTVLNEAKLIHCDLKPENILLKSLQSPQIKVIDFGSACHERQTVYTYIQSRFYRSPEVLLGLPYTSAIDMWSLGCIAVELFLGLPLFPGTSEYNQITRIVEMLGMPPSYMLDMGKQTSQFFTSYTDEYGRKKYRLKTIEQFSREHGTQEQPGKKYFAANALPDIVRTAPQPKSATKPADLEKGLSNRAAFIDFVQGLLNLNPIERWSPQQARLHPFITGEKFIRPYVPADGAPRPSPQSVVTPVDPKRPYGGLVPAQPKGTRAYQDAASYNQHLAQHQAYTAQAASQAANQPVRNPYVSNPPQQVAPAQSYERQDYGGSSNAHADAGLHQTTQPHGQAHRLQHQSSAGSLNPTSSTYPIHSQQQQPSHASYGMQSLGVTNPNPPSTSYYPPARIRANTINQIDGAVPPQIARIASLGMDISGIKRNTLTPVLNREEAIKEWERRQSGQRQPPPAYPQLEYLQQQADSWNGSSHSTARRYAPHPPSSLQHFQSPASAITVDSNVTKHHDKSVSGGLRDVTMSASRPTAGGYDQSASHHHATLPPAPPQAYTTNSNAASRYAPPPPFQQSPSSVPYDTFDHRDGMGTLYAPMQPSLLSGSQQQQQQHHHQPNNSSGSTGGTNVGSFYSNAISAPQRLANPFSTNTQQQVPVNAPPQTHQIDLWPR